MPQRWSNWSGSVVCTPQTIEAPRSEEALAAAVAGAARAERTVRVVGSGHSFTPLCATDGLLLSLDKLQGMIATEHNEHSDEQTATFWAGTKIHAMGEPLLQAGLAMENMGDIDRQSIAGAIGTGTHGTGRTLGNISTQVVGLRLITAMGEIVDCSPSQNPELFKAAQVSFGTLGVLSRVTLRVLPAYRLHEHTWVEPFDECAERLEERIAANRHFEFFWVPGEDVCACKALNPTDETSVPSDAAYQPPAGRLARYVGPQRIDWSHRIFPSERNLKFNEMEYAVPAEAGAACLREIRRLMQTLHPDVAWPIEYRTVAADDLWLSPAHGRATVTISIHQAAELPHQHFFAEAEGIFRTFQGRPHWGKMHTCTGEELAALYPRWSQYAAIRAGADPLRLFLNEELQAFWP